MNTKIIQSYIINLKSRGDRQKFIISQFNGRDEFEVHLIDACQNRIGAIGLWHTIRKILKDLMFGDEEFIILCEDDHKFTFAYSIEYLLACIEAAKAMNADILSGGISGFTSTVPVSDNLYWVEKFSGLQFTVIFRKFFQTILNAGFGPGDAADYKICSLTENKFFIYPFISIQKDFGYSDVTPGNNLSGHVEKVFKDSNEKVQILQTVSAFYRQKSDALSQWIIPLNIDSIVLPAYVIRLPERTDRLAHIEKQFAGRKEFDVTIVEACRHKIGAVGLWLSIRKIIETAIKKEDDVILICEDDHEFTNHYERGHFISSVWHAAQMGCHLLNGGIGGFNLAVQVTDGMFWIDSFWCTQFIVIYRNFFEDILNEPFTETDTADGKFSEMTSQKMALFPFISVQKNFGYSDVTRKNHETNGLITQYFENAGKRLLKHQMARQKFNGLRHTSDINYDK